jgi:predicted RNA-binding protein with TRAM domain
MVDTDQDGFYKVSSILFCLLAYIFTGVYRFMSEDSEREEQVEEVENQEENVEEQVEETVEEETVEEEAVEEPEDEEVEETDDTEESEEEEEDFDKPVSEGEVVEVDIEDLGSKGDGIARKEGFVIFVPGGEVGETYDVEVTSVGRKFAFAEIDE